MKKSFTEITELYYTQLIRVCHLLVVIEELTTDKFKKAVKRIEADSWLKEFKEAQTEFKLAFHLLESWQLYSSSRDAGAE